VISAVLPILLIHRYGYNPYFLSIGAMSGLAVLSALAIRDCDIDHLSARGSALADDGDDRVTQRGKGAAGTAGGVHGDGGDFPTPGIRRAVAAATARGTGTIAIQAALCRQTVLLFCSSVLLFHLANGAMLPTLGQKIDALSTHNASRVSLYGTNIDGAIGVSLSTIVAQVVMIPTALLAKHAASNTRWGGRKRTLLVGFCILPLRGAFFATSSSIWLLLAAQSMDGVGAGIFGVIAPTIMADLARSTGRFSLMQGVLCTVVGLGASLSGGVAGLVAQEAGFRAAFLVLAAIATAAVLVLVSVRETGPRASSSVPAGRWARVGIYIASMLTLGAFSLLAWLVYHTRGGDGDPDGSSSTEG
jgi:hypothetical protein